jgi:hypothetical protein
VNDVKGQQETLRFASAILAGAERGLTFAGEILERVMIKTTAHLLAIAFIACCATTSTRAETPEEWVSFARIKARAAAHAAETAVSRTRLSVRAAFPSILCAES